MLDPGDTALPAWPVEGFAEFVATVDNRSNDSVVFGRAPECRASGMLADQLVPAKRLPTVVPAQLSSEETFVFHSRSWLLTHYLRLDLVRRKQVDAYLTAVNRGASPLDAAQALRSPGKLDGDAAEKKQDSGSQAAASRQAAQRTSRCRGGIADRRR